MGKSKSANLTYCRVKIYDLSSGKSLPEYMEEAKKRKIKLKHLEDYNNRIELI
jgi:ribosome biogenesis protein ENP2